MDINLIDLGNFPLWNIDLFRCSPIDSYNNSKFSHILDFDMLRLGKKVIENNKNSNAFEFGIIVITEVGKERKNTLELKETKKNDDEANQKNDLFNSWLKMARHLLNLICHKEADIILWDGIENPSALASIIFLRKFTTILQFTQDG